MRYGAINYKMLYLYKDYKYMVPTELDDLWWFLYVHPHHGRSPLTNFNTDYYLKLESLTDLELLLLDIDKTKIPGG